MMVDGITGFLFLDKDGRPKVGMHLQNYMREMRTRYQKLYGGSLPSITPHVLRHTFCTRFCENETNIKVIQEIMGHADISTTMNVYAEATEAKKRESFNNLEGKIRIS